MPGAPKLIFSSAVQAMLDVAQGRVKPETAQKLTDYRFIRKHLEPAYPAEHWAEAVKLISADLYSELPIDEQHRQLGRATVKQFADTIMGKAMFTVAKVLGARRSLTRMTNNLKTGANFIETRFTVIDDRHQELWINDVSGVPGFYAGLLGVGAEYVEGWADSIELKTREGASCIYELRRTK